MKIAFIALGNWQIILAIAAIYVIIEEKTTGVTMAPKKQNIKLSEARILVFLEHTDRTLHFVRNISFKLQIDYGYIIRLLQAMKEKGWLVKHKSMVHSTRSYYNLTPSGKQKVLEANKIVILNAEVKQ